MEDLKTKKTNEVVIRSSIIRAALKDEGEAAWYLQGGKLEPTENMLVGSAAHCLILEPEKFEETFTIVDTQRRGTKEWKLALMSDKTPIKRDIYNKCVEIKDAFWEAMKSDEYQDIKKAIESGVKEEWIQVQGPNTNSQFSIKPDVYTKDTLIDYKTTCRKCVTSRQWQTIVNEYKYDVQVSFYMNMLNLTKKDEGVDIKNIYHIVQSTEPPYCLSVFFFPQVSLELAYKRMITGLYSTTEILRNIGNIQRIWLETEEGESFVENNNFASMI